MTPLLNWPFPAVQPVIRPPSLDSLGSDNGENIARQVVEKTILRQRAFDTMAAPHEIEA